jgi:ketosteroid isomerase-like protein
VTKESSRAKDETQIRNVIEGWADALRAKNAEGVVSHHAADFIQFSLAPPLVSAGDVEKLQAWFATWQGPIGYEIHNLGISAGDCVAYCHSLNRMSGTRDGGEKTDLWFRQTLGLRKIDSRWVIAHAHASVPFYMDGSYRAAVDLEPP